MKEADIPSPDFRIFINDEGLEEFIRGLLKFCFIIYARMPCFCLKFLFQPPLARNSNQKKRSGKGKRSHRHHGSGRSSENRATLFKGANKIYSDFA